MFWLLVKTSYLPPENIDEAPICNNFLYLTSRAFDAVDWATTPCAIDIK